MPNNNLYIVDNSSEEQSVKQYLIDWCNVSKQMDIATGYLEIGGLLSLDTHWQKVDKIRIILGNEVTKRTKDVIDEVVKSLLNGVKKSIDDEHEKSCSKIDITIEDNEVEKLTIFFNTVLNLEKN